MLAQVPIKREEETTSSKITEMVTGINPVGQELVVTYRGLAVLYRSGVPVTRALEIMHAQAVHPRLKKALEGTMRHVGNGQSVSWAMSLYPRVFPDVVSRLVEAGETSGNMEGILERLAVHAEKTNATSMKVRSALTYPAFVLVLCLAMLIVVPALTFDGILGLSADLGQKVPLPTQILKFCSTVLRNPFLLTALIAGIIGGIFAFRQAWREKNFRKMVQKLMFKVPGLGQALLSAEVANFSRTLSTLYESGVSILPALELSAKSTTNVMMQEAILRVKSEVASGTPFSVAMQGTGFFPPMLVHLIAAGDESGTVGYMLERAAVICDESVDRSLEMATAALEPMMLLLVGAVVGFIVIATLAPMLEAVKGLA